MRSDISERNAGDRPAAQGKEGGEAFGGSFTHEVDVSASIGSRFQQLEKFRDDFRRLGCPISCFPFRRPVVIEFDMTVPVLDEAII